MTRLSLVFILFSAVAVSCANAAPITYKFYSFPGSGTETTSVGGTPTTVPIHGVLSGSITTDGALGAITAADITSFSWGSTGAGGSTSDDTVLTLLAQGVTATTTTLSLVAGGKLELATQTHLNPMNIFSNEDFTIAESGGGIAWNGDYVNILMGGTAVNIGGSYQTLQIASLAGGTPPGIPEPSTVVLMMLGGGLLVARRIRR
ncbi:MAG TPA: PEP-CTERM sorting domain-containing protein [Pirellulales bacterium]|nr:PEP-CTERM sorting domain-containing protein [Pirellulales bacterium]